MNSFAIAMAIALFYAAVFWWIIRSTRRGSNKALTKRRLLIKDQDGIPVWRILRARVLVGWVNNNGAVTSGSWAKSESETRDSTWAVLQTSKGKLIAYRFDDYQPNQPKTGSIQVCDSWPALESSVPPQIFEEALLAAGIKKPTEYREAPLEL